MIEFSRPISDIWRAHDAGPIRRAGRAREWRAIARHRGGKNWSVWLSDDTGTWRDHAAGEGGGILALVQHLKGCDRQEAARWLADFSGVPRREWTVEERRDWARTRREMERDLSTARYWRRAISRLLEDDLNSEKAKLFDPLEDTPDYDLIASYTRLFETLRHLSGQALVREYRDWRAEMPTQCAALVRWAREREQAEVRALAQYLADTEAWQ